MGQRRSRRRTGLNDQCHSLDLFVAEQLLIALRFQSAFAVLDNLVTDRTEEWGADQRVSLPRWKLNKKYFIKNERIAKHQRIKITFICKMSHSFSNILDKTRLLDIPKVS